MSSTKGSLTSAGRSTTRQSFKTTALVLVFRWHKLGARYARAERRYLGGTLGSSIPGRGYVCLPPRGCRPRNALVLVFRWHKLAARHAGAERTSDVRTLGSSIPRRWCFCLPRRECRRRTALVLVFRWHKLNLAARYVRAERRFVDLARGRNTPRRT